MCASGNIRAPRFRSLEEEAEFWDTHSPLDYPDQWKEVEKARAERPLGHILAVRLDAHTIDKLAAIARKKGIGPSTLARMWILEHLADLEEQERERTTKPTRRIAEDHSERRPYGEEL